jgi:hypothetical protein
LAVAAAEQELMLILAEVKTEVLAGAMAVMEVIVVEIIKFWVKEPLVKDLMVL